MRLGSGFRFDPQQVGYRAYKIELDRRDFGLFEAWFVGRTFPLEVRLTIPPRAGEDVVTFRSGDEVKKFLRGLKIGLGV